MVFYVFSFILLNEKANSRGTERKIKYPSVLKRAIKESKVETCFQTQKLHSVPFTLRTSTITRLKRLKRRYLLSYSIPLLTG